MMELPRNLPVGVRFHPTDEELLMCYLWPKILGDRFDKAIAEVDLCAHEPWELPRRSYIRSEDRQWWFICRQNFINAKSRRVNRATRTGFWKITGQDRVIKDQKSKTCIGKKRNLVFHSNPSGKRTNWVMQEYFVNSDIALPRERASYVICRLKVKTDETVDTPYGESNANIFSDPENSGPSSAIQWLHDQIMVNGDPEQAYADMILTVDDMRMRSLDDLTPAVYSLQSGRDESEESPEDFADGYLAVLTDGNLYSESTPPASLKRSYFRDGPNSSDADADAANGRHGRLSGSSSLSNSPASPTKFQRMRMVKKSSESLRTFATTGYVSEPKVKPSQFPEEKPSSESLGKHVMELSSHVSVKGGDRQKRIQIRNNSSSTATSSYKGKISPGLVATSSLEQRSVESSSSKWKSFFVFAEPSSVSRGDLSLPLSVYWFNTLVGSLFFVIFIRELVVFGSW